LLDSAQPIAKRFDDAAQRILDCLNFKQILAQQL
jgi:hypothetical protein